jgi:hypothetical protein
MNESELGMILDVTPGEYEKFERRLIEGMGHRIEVCRGPDGLHGTCPMLEGETCTLLGQARGVVFKLDLDREEHRQILSAYQRELPEDTPVAVALRPGQERAYADLLEGVYVWSHQPTAVDLDGFGSLVEAADRARE